MRTIAVISQKGGAGKTLLACALAVEAEHAGLATVLLDLDPQASAARWSDLRGEDAPVVVSVHSPRLATVLETAARQGTGIAIIDTPPHGGGIALDAARAADLVLIPCRPAAPDLHAVRQTVDVTALARVDAVGVVNAAPPRGRLVAEAREALRTYHIDVAPQTVHTRIAHVHAWTAGRAATESEPRGKAAAELRAITAWTFERAGLAAFAARGAA